MVSRSTGEKFVEFSFLTHNPFSKQLPLSVHIEREELLYNFCFLGESPANIHGGGVSDCLWKGCN